MSAAARNLSVLSRGLSTSSASLSGLVKAPVNVYGTGGRYASALYSAASKKKALPAVEKDLTTFQTTLSKDSRLREFLADPSINKSLKSEGLAGACDKLKMNALSKNCMLALAENGRYSIIGDVIGSFSTIMAAHRGEVVCEVVTAKTLTAANTKEVEAVIGKFLKAGQKSLITYKVDPTIIGGMVVSIGDKFVDMSIQSKINKYSEIIRSAA